MQTFDYKVNDEPQTTSKHELTAAEILVNAGFEVASHYVILVQGNHQVSYKDKPNEEIHMHEHMRFLVISMEPTTVSGSWK